MMTYDEFVERRDRELTAKYENRTIKDDEDFDDFCFQEYDTYVAAYVKASYEAKMIPWPDDMVSDTTGIHDAIEETDIPY